LQRQLIIGRLMPWWDIVMSGWCFFDKVNLWGVLGAVMSPAFEHGEK
jgi:hypothetical protein